MREQIADGRGPIPMIRRAIGLKAVDTNLGGRMQVPAGVGPEGFDVTVVALGLAAEQRVPAIGCRWIEAAGGRLRRRDSQLIELESLKLGRNLIVIGADVLSSGKPEISETVNGRDRKLRSVV